MFQEGADAANGAKWGRVSMTLRSNRTGEEVVWIAALRKRQEPEIEHENIYEVVGFYRLDLDDEELI